MGLSPNALALEVQALHELFRMWYRGHCRANGPPLPNHVVFREDVERIRPGVGEYITPELYLAWYKAETDHD